MNKIVKVVKHPQPYLMKLTRLFVHILPQKTYLKILFYLSLGYKLNLKEPKSFNEKLQWLKIHRHNDHDTLLVDKYEVKLILREIFGDEYIVPTYGVYNKFNEIDFNSLPDKFVIKTTHQSGGVIVCNDKNQLNLDHVKKIINNKLSKNLYYWGLEWPYKNVKPRIIIEKNISNGQEVRDYKLMCFNGKVKCSFVCSERNSKSGLKVDFYDKNWSHMPFTRHYLNSDSLIPKPQNYDKMIYIAERVSKEMPFLRVDFFEIDGQLFIGELTFYPGCGFEEFTPREWDFILGSWINLKN